MPLLGTLTVGSALLAVAVAAGAGGALTSSLPNMRSRRHDRAALAMLIGCCIALVAATFMLGSKVVTEDWSLAYAVRHARTGTSAWYRIAAVWAGAEGSLLLFATGLTVVGTVTALVIRDRHVTRFAGFLASSHALAVLAVANPFEVLALPDIRGTGLTPILEHPAMLFHPPVLYSGLVSTTALALAAMSPALPSISWVRRVVLIAVGLLTVGLATGSNWAYAELGWGGYWGWDPVENTVLIVWLLLLVLMHVLRGNASETTTRVAMMAPLVATLFGSAVTRSGGLSSVHAFADSGALGWALGLTGGAAVTASALSVRHLHQRAKPTGSGLASGVRPVQIRVAALLGLLAALVVLVGVSWPLVAPGDPVVLGRFYSRLLGPLAVVAVIAGLATIAWAIWRRSIPMATMALGHLAFAVLLVGVAGTTQADRRTVLVSTGDTFEVADHTFDVRALDVGDGPRPRSEAATLTIAMTEPSGTQSILRPALITYPLDQIVLPEVATTTSLRRDVQVFAQVVTRDGLVQLHVEIRPLVSMIWIGAGLLAAATALGAVQSTSLSRSRFDASSASSDDGALVSTG